MHYLNCCILLYTLGLLEKEDSETKETRNGNRYSSSAVLVARSCPTLCDLMDYSPPASSAHGILQQEYWSGLPCPPPGDLPNPGIEPVSPTLQADSLLSEPLGKPKYNVRAMQTVEDELEIGSPRAPKISLTPNLPSLAPQDPPPFFAEF